MLEIAAHALYRQQYVRCGRPACHCAAGHGHGPYWYAVWRDGKRVRSRYIGKTLPPDAASKLARSEASASAGITTRSTDSRVGKRGQETSR